MPDPAFLPQPQRGILCLGGPLDGQWRDLSDSWRAALNKPPLMVLTERDERWRPDKVEVVEIVYKRVRIELDGRTVDVLLVQGMDPGDVLVRLLEGYRPHGPQRA